MNEKPMTPAEIERATVERCAIECIEIANDENITPSAEACAYDCAAAIRALPPMFGDVLVMADGREINLDAIEAAALSATPQQIDTAQFIHDCEDEDQTIECPHCQGEGYVYLEGDYCNFDGAAIGVQFYGIGNEFGAAERYYRAANPRVVLEIVRRLRAAAPTAGQAAAKDAQDAARYRWLRRQDQNTTIKMTHYGFDALDSIIDAAMAAAPEVK